MPEQQLQTLRCDDEAELISRARQKDNAAAKIIIQRHNRRLYRIARSVVRNDSEAEDVVQEAYLRAFTNLAEFRGDSSLATWLSRIVLNEALGRVRRRRPTVDLTSIEQQRSQVQTMPFPLASATRPRARLGSTRDSTHTGTEDRSFAGALSNRTGCSRD